METKDFCSCRNIGVLVSLGCGHSFCRTCLQKNWGKNQTQNCPRCGRRSSKEFRVGFKLEEQNYKEVEEEYLKMQQHALKQVVESEHHIRAVFGRMQRHLQEEEQRALSALREEQSRQSQSLEAELQKVREEMSSLNTTVQASGTEPAAPHSVPKAGLLLDQAKVLGNLGFRAWSSLRSTFHFHPVILDPNTANGLLCVWEELSAVSRADAQQDVPDNPERFTNYSNVLGAEGFSRGTHQWDVEVGDLPHWTVGVARASVDRRRDRTGAADNGLNVLLHDRGKYSNGSGVTVPVGRAPQRVRVQLDYDRGEVSFYDAELLTHLYTDRDTFTEEVFPFFTVGPAGGAQSTGIRICPCQPPVSACQPPVSAEQH